MQEKMNRRAWLYSVSSLVLAPAAAYAQTATAEPNLPTKKVLLHVHTEKVADWTDALKRAQGYMKSSAKPYDTYVEILATGDGLKLVKQGSAVHESVMKALEADITFVACYASMKANHMPIDQLHPGVGTVPSGGREKLARKNAGWDIQVVG